MAAQALGADDEFFAEFTRTQKEYFFHKDRMGADSRKVSLLLSYLAHTLHLVDLDLHHVLESRRPTQWAA
jgi:hypothetical protein